MSEWRVWIAHHFDWSGIAVFDNELDALRFAVVNGMTVTEHKSGEEIR